MGHGTGCTAGSTSVRPESSCGRWFNSGLREPRTRPPAGRSKAPSRPLRAPNPAMIRAGILRRARAAEILGIFRQTLITGLKEYGAG